MLFVLGLQYINAELFEEDHQAQTQHPLVRSYPAHRHTQSRLLCCVTMGSKQDELRTTEVAWAGRRNEVPGGDSHSCFCLVCQLPLSKSHQVTARQPPESLSRAKYINQPVTEDSSRFSRSPCGVPITQQKPPGIYLPSRRLGPRVMSSSVQAVSFFPLTSTLIRLYA